MNSWDNINVIKNYARLYSYLFLQDSNGSSWNLYRQYGYVPLNYVIDNDANQTVRFWMEGFNEPTIRYYIEQALGVEEDETGSRQRATSTSLLQNYPNPFSHTTTIPYSLPGRRGDTETRRGGEVSTYQLINLSVYDLSGRLVATLVDGPEEAGSHTVRWDGRDSSGNQVGSGIYFYQLTTGDYSACRRLAVLR